MDDDNFLEAYLNTLEVSESAEGGDTVTGMATRPYGVKDLLGVNEEDYKNDPRGLAKAVASKNIDELKRMGIDWDNLPTSMKFNALDIQFNMGSLNTKAPNYFKAVKSGDYADAIRESLDAIGAYDPKRKGERPTKGIALRRAMFYNMVANELDYPTITSLDAINQDNANKSAKVTYNFSKGEALPVEYATLSLHSTTRPGTVQVEKLPGIDAEIVPRETQKQFSGNKRIVTPPQPKPAVPEKQTGEAFSLDYQGELPDIGEDVPMPDLPATDVAPETTDAIPVTPVEEPEQPGLFDRFMSMFSSEDDPDKIQERELAKQNLLQELETFKAPAMNKGGIAMERQMNMFEDGGLMDEGGMIDEESGNDVPPGSLREEVRDDIPAQLSEGEFVFPADVVRYWGLEKLMEMRQEAKAGLARMEAMGQMGNADEATLPDDIPFDLDDLDMEDEPMEFQQGGLVPNPYGVYQQPSQFATYGQQPYQVPQMPVAPVAPQVPLQTGFTPVTTPVTPTAPTFEELLPTTTGKYDELREYVNSETGESMTIPFVDGKPIYPIPTGFTPKPTEQVEAAVPEDTVVPTATVQKEEGEGRVTGPEYATTDVTGIGYDRSQLTPALRETISEYGFGFGALAEVAGKTNVANVIGELMGKDPKVAAKNLTSSAFGGVLDAFRGGEVSFSDPNRMGMKTGKYNDNTPLHEMSATKQIDIATVADRVMKDMQGVFTDEKGKPKTTAEATRSMKALADSLGVSTTVEGTNLTKSLTTLMREVSKQKGIQVKAQLEKEKAEAERQRAERQQANRATAYQSSIFDKQEGDGPQVGGAGVSRDVREAIAEAKGYTGGGKYGGFAEGGLASKPKKTKKMKRGGLASK